MQRSAEDAALGDQEAPAPKRQRPSTATTQSSDDELSQPQSSAQVLNPPTRCFVNPLLIRNCGNGFPQYSRAKVYIEVVWLSKDYTYRLNPDVLTAWFVNILKQPIHETNISKAEKIKQETGCYFKFELSYTVKCNFWVLKRVPFTLSYEWVPPYSIERARASRNQESGSHTAKTAPPGIKYADGSNVPLLVAEAYDNMFRLMNKMDIKFDTKDLENAFAQAEKLIEVTTFYGCPELVRHVSLGNHFLDFNRVLFMEIMLDAPRWLKLSIHLENESIFREAMIHMVGKYPSSSWKTKKSPMLPDAVWKTIKSKYNHIMNFKTYVDMKLLNNRATLYSRSSSFKNAPLQMWLLSNIWHTWVEHAISKRSDANPNIGTYAVMYKLMDAGGDAYLPAYSVYKELKSREQKGSQYWDLKEIEEELDAMKTYAQTVVSNLCVNHSVLNVEEFEIDYMTCCLILDHEIPWLKSRYSHFSF